MNDQEYLLMDNLKGYLIELGVSEIVYFSASFVSDGSWIARVDYRNIKKNPNVFYGMMLDGTRDIVHMACDVPPRRILTFPSILELTEGLIRIEDQEFPDFEERSD